jgi:hypothetical protein
MKHLKIILMMLCFVYTGTRAQTIERSVVASAGGSYAGTVLVDYTIGQTVTNYSSGPSYVVTEGFHPINYGSTTTAAPIVKVANSLDIAAYPNPSSGVLHVAISQQIAEPVILSVIDMMGKTVKTVSLDGQTIINADIDLSAFASGMYYITANAGKENAQVMKIVKN